MNLKALLCVVVAVSVSKAAVVRPEIATTIKGGNGNELPMTIIAVWSDGFHIKQGGTKPPLFVTWDKVDIVWLEAERPEIAKIKATAKPFPVLTEAEARSKIDAARKTFRAPKEVSYGARTSNGASTIGTARNELAHTYANKLKTITPQNITQALRQIISDRNRDLEKLAGANGADGAQGRWLSTQFGPCLAALEKAQREIDPLNAGTLDLTPPASTARVSDPFAPQPDPTWF
jgi:hypothetical protein